MHSELALKAYQGTFGKPEKHQLEDLMKFLELVIAEPYPDWIKAYILSTVGNETFHRFSPTEFPDPKLKKYFGRGLVPLRGKEAYARASQLLGENLVAKPELVLEYDIAYALATQGMWEGVFTGVALKGFAGSTGKNLIQARQVVTADQVPFLDRYIEELVERTWLKVVVAALYGQKISYKEVKAALKNDGLQKP